MFHVLHRPGYRRAITILIGQDIGGPLLYSSARISAGMKGLRVRNEIKRGHADAYADVDRDTKLAKRRERLKLRRGGGFGNDGVDEAVQAVEHDNAQPTAAAQSTVVAVEVSKTKEQ